jgi:hypothetical protein
MILTFTMTSIQKTIVTAVLTGAVFTGIYQARQASKLDKQVRALQAQNAPLAARVAELESQNVQLSNQLRTAANAPAPNQAQLSELMRLRDQSTRAQGDSDELARLKAAVNDRPAKIPDYMTNAMAVGLATAENWKKKDSAERLTRMKEMLRLSDSQVQAIGIVMTNHIAGQSQMAMEMMSGKLSAEQIREQRASGAKDQQAEIRAILTAEQLDQMPEFERAENQFAAETLSRTEARQIAEQFSLSPDQQEQLRTRLSGFNSEQTTGKATSLSGADDPENAFELEKQMLDKKSTVLESFLSPEQVAAYRKAQLDRLQMQASALKMISRIRRGGEPGK